jgi:hypothetical protein
MTTIVVVPDKEETCLMDDTVTFVGTFRIPNRGAWLPAIARMSDFVASNVPRVVAFHAYANAEAPRGRSSTCIRTLTPWISTSPRPLSLSRREPRWSR